MSDEPNASLQRGIDQAAAGQTQYLGSFAQYLDRDEIVDALTRRAEVAEAGLAQAVEMVESLMYAFHPGTFSDCWTPDTCGEAVADGEEHGWCPACSVTAFLAAHPVSKKEET